MIQRLIILGLLKKNPASGYDIKKFINKELGMFAEPQAQSIYYPLKKMEKEGLIKRKEFKGTSRLKKYTYAITPKGEREFLNLCEDTLLSQRRPFIELDVALYFLPFLDKRKITSLLRWRMMFLEKVREWLLEKEEELKESPKNLTLLVKHQSQLAVAEKDFIEDMIKVIKK
ncbi:MAG: PadR family transcriptional regulator [Candidatus Omnitrophota bacterium]|nr:MAG: PadR family transcriptional regulator [Candidatus Omnitrophota bacterium]